MEDLSAAMSAVVAHLRSGDVQGADDIASKALSAAEADAAKAAGQPPAPVAPRAPIAVGLDIVNVISRQMGHPPALVDLIVELNAALGHAGF